MCIHIVRCTLFKERERREREVNIGCYVRVWRKHNSTYILVQSLYTEAKAIHVQTLSPPPSRVCCDVEEDKLSKRRRRSKQGEGRTRRPRKREEEIKWLLAASSSSSSPSLSKAGRPTVKLCYFGV